MVVPFASSHPFTGWYAEARLRTLHDLGWHWLTWGCGKRSFTLSGLELTYHRRNSLQKDSVNQGRSNLKTMRHACPVRIAEELIAHVMA
jgi:hypothetical protein